MVYTYILLCKDGTYYTGWTTDLVNRLKAHNGQVPGGAKYTMGRRPVTLVWVKRFAEKQEAQRMEYRIKRMTKSGKARFMMVTPSDCVDLEA